MKKVSHLLFVVVLAASQTSFAQNQTPTQDEAEVRITTNLVQTDVAVFDKDGRFVDNLQQSDFELKVDGTSQPLSFFERVGNATDSLNANRTSDTLPNTAANNIASSVSTPPRVVTFYVDDLHLTPEGVNRVRRVLSNFIENQMPANSQAMIVAASGRVGFLAQPTDDKEALRRAMRRITYQSRASIANDRPMMSAYQAMAIDRGDREALAYQVQQTIYQNRPASPPPSIVESTVRSRARIVRRQAADLSRGVISNLEAVVRSLPVNQTRNVIFYLSQGFVIDNSEADIVYRMRRVIDQAARRNAVVYTIDARGLAVGNLDASMDVVSDIASIDSATSPSYNSLREISATQEPLRSLAADTGGRALLNNNNIEGLVKRTIDETSRYYLLGWRPSTIDERTGEPKFRRIEISIKNRPDLKVRARRGFFNRLPDDANATRSIANATTPNAALNAALNAPTMRRDVPVALYATFANTAPEGSTLNAVVQLDAGVINFKEVTGANNQSPVNNQNTVPQTTTNQTTANQATINVACVLLDDAGKAIYSDGRNLTLTGNGASVTTNAGALVTNFAVPIVKAGIYQFRVAARDAQTGRIGTAFEFITVPDFKPNRLALSSPVLVTKMSNAKTDSFINVERKFPRASRIVMQLYVYNAATKTESPAPDVEMEIKIMRGTQTVLNAAPHKLALSNVTDKTRISYGAEIPLNALAPGAYTLLVSARDLIGRNDATRQVNFTVQ